MTGRKARADITPRKAPRVNTERRLSAPYRTRRTNALNKQYREGKPLDLRAARGHKPQEKETVRPTAGPSIRTLLRRFRAFNPRFTPEVYALAVSEYGRDVVRQQIIDTIAAHDEYVSSIEAMIGPGVRGGSSGWWSGRETSEEPELKPLWWYH